MTQRSTARTTHPSRSIVRRGCGRLGLALVVWMAACGGAVEDSDAATGSNPDGCPSAEPTWLEPCSEAGLQCSYDVLACPSSAEPNVTYHYECTELGYWFVREHGEPACDSSHLPEPGCPEQSPWFDDPCPEAGAECSYDYDEPCPDGTTSSSTFRYECTANGTWQEVWHDDPAC